MSKTKELQEELISHIAQLKIAWYLKEEAAACLKYLSIYKLKNIEKNLTHLCDYLVFLNKQNTEKFLALSESQVKPSKTCNRDLSYFFSPEKKMTSKAKKLYLETIASQSYHLLSLVQGIRGILVLSIDEFCNASDTRICIHTMLMKQHTEPPCKSLAKKNKKLTS